VDLVNMPDHTSASTRQNNNCLAFPSGNQAKLRAAA
jgi:hypothetical protein